MFSWRRAEVRWAAVVSSRGMGLPSAVEGTREVEDEFVGWKKRGGKVNGKECLRFLEGRLGFWGLEDEDEGGAAGLVGCREEVGMA